MGAAEAPGFLRTLPWANQATWAFLFFNVLATELSLTHDPMQDPGGGSGKVRYVVK